MKIVSVSKYMDLTVLPMKQVHHNISMLFCVSHIKTQFCSSFRMTLLFKSGHSFKNELEFHMLIHKVTYKLIMNMQSYEEETLLL